MTLEELTRKFDLTHTHILSVNSGSLAFKRLAASSENASVYVWVACKPGKPYHVLYVGKAGRGVHLRCTQHMAGFVNSGTGRKNAEELKRYLSDGYEVRVYSRESGKTQVLGQVVSLYSAEEDALCLALNPVLNRALFPSARDSGKKQLPLATSDQPILRVNIGQLINNRLIQLSTITTDDFLAQWDAYSDDQRISIEKLLGYIETQLSLQHRAKLVVRYSGQPTGCNGVTTLTYAIPGPSGSMEKRSWQARVYFGAQTRIGFPLDRLKKTAHAKVDISERENTFSPKSTEAFIQNPDYYLKKKQSSMKAVQRKNFGSTSEYIINK